MAAVAPQLSAARLCIDCHSAPIEGGDERSRFCRGCSIRHRSAGRQASARRKYRFTPEIDGELRRCYLEPNKATKPGIHFLMKKYGWPKHAFLQRAQKLGIARVKEKPWSEPELEILQRFSWMIPYNIALKLKEAGFHRTPTGVNLKLKRMRFRADNGWYSATKLALCFGQDQHVITMWITLGYLSSRRKETFRTPQQGGDPWAVHELEVYLFLRDYRNEYDTRKVYQEWFQTIIFDLPARYKTELRKHPPVGAE